MTDRERKTARSTNLLHCWEAGPEAADGCPTTCMLGRDHIGRHEWTRDDQIFISVRPLMGEGR